MGGGGGSDCSQLFTVKHSFSEKMYVLLSGLHVWLPVGVT